MCVTEWHSVERLFWKLWTKRHSLSADEVIRCVWLCIYKNLESLPDTSSQIFIGNLARHSFSLFDRNKTQRQTSKTSEQRPAYHWQNDGRLQKFADNQILCWLISCRHRCPSVIKFQIRLECATVNRSNVLLISKAYFPANKMNWM